MIIVTANARDARYVSDDLITSGSIGIPVSFVLSDDFDGLSNIAVFKGSGASVDVALTSDNACVVPPETVAQPGGYLHIGVYGRNADGTIAIPTVWAGARMILQGAKPSGVDPAEPTPDWTAQVQQIATKALETAQDVERRADAGEFDGDPGPKGDTGDVTPAAQQALSDAQAAARAAEIAAEQAEASASNAAGSAQSAANARNDAAGSAQSAANSSAAAQSAAERAAQSAGQAGYMFFAIDERGHLILNRTSNTQVDFYLRDGHLYVKGVA